VIADIRTRGDSAVRQYAERFDGDFSHRYRMAPEEIREAIDRVPAQTIKDITFVQQQVRVMAQRHLDSVQDFEFETLPGVRNECRISLLG
jgi:sulfopropanediol 3-dehydrogenase